MGRRFLFVALALVAYVGGAQAAGTAHIATPPPFTVAAWNANSDNVAFAHGTVTSNGAPVAGARVSVDGYVLPAPTDAGGHFTATVDATLLARHVVAVVGAKDPALAAARGAITVAYPIVDLKESGTTITGRIAFTPNTKPLPVSLYSYELTGRVTDAGGRPVSGAYVSTRTGDRDYWTVSTKTDSQGRYSSLFTASDELGSNPVPMAVRVALGNVVYQFLRGEFVKFQALHSSTLDLRLPPRGYPMPLPLPRSYPGAIYEAVVVGAASGGAPIRPVRVTWPDTQGRFTIVLPASLAGKTVSLWEDRLDLFSTAAATPGGTIDLRDWPTALAPDAPQDLARVKLR